MIRSIRKILILVRRDFLEEISYRVKFALDIVTIFVYSSIFYFISQTFGGGASRFLERYGGDYFSFVLIGIAFTGYLSIGLNTFSSTIRNEQMMGTLEIIISTPTPLSLIFTARMFWNFLYGSFHLLIYFFVGVVLLKANYANTNWAAVPVILLLSFATFNSIGMISAGFVLIFKRGDPINVLFGFAASLMSGVFFPVEVMPAALQKIAAFIPLTYTLRLMRDACILGAPFSKLAPDLLLLVAISAVLVPASHFFFSYSLRRSKKDGTLTHY